MNNDKTPMEKFEELGRKLFSIVKKDTEKVEEAIEKAIEPTETPEADE